MAKLVVIVVVAAIVTVGIYGRAYEINRNNSPSPQRSHYQVDEYSSLGRKRPVFRSSFGGESFHSSRSNSQLQTVPSEGIGRHKYSVHDGHAYGAHSGEYFGKESNSWRRQTQRRFSQKY